MASEKLTGLKLTGLVDLEPKFASIADNMNRAFSKAMNCASNKVTNSNPAMFNKVYFQRDGSKIIVSHPVIVCIIESQGRRFKGKAKCNPNDTWNEELGTKIAKNRALIKLHKSALNFNEEMYLELKRDFERAYHVCMKRLNSLEKRGEYLLNLTK